MTTKRPSKPPKNVGGRPKRAPETVMKHKISVWFSEEQYGALLRVKPEGYPVATWARKKLLEVVTALDEAQHAKLAERARRKR